MYDWYLDRQIDDYCDQPQDLDDRDILIIANDYDLTKQEDIINFAHSIVGLWKDNNQYGTC
jgi:hypothetical protein